MYRIFILSLLVQTSCTCSLNELYRDEDIRLVIYENLSQVFEVKFNEIIDGASIYEPYLYCPALYFKEEIKRMFIEDGFIFANSIDLDKALNELNYLKIEKFRKNKEFFKSSEVNSRLNRRSIENGRCDNK